MLDLNAFRVDAGGDPDVARESQRRRGASVDAVTAVVDLDSRWREQLQRIRAVRSEAGAEAASAATAARAPGSSSETRAAAARAKRELADRLNPLEQEERALRGELHRATCRVGALVHEQAPVRPELLALQGGAAAGAAEAAEAAEAVGPARNNERHLHDATCRAMVESGWAEPSPGGQWRLCGAALLSQYAMLTQARKNRSNHNHNQQQ